MKAICVEVCLPVINDVMESNAHVVFLLPRGESTARFAWETKPDLSGCFLLPTLFCSELHTRLLPQRHVQDVHKYDMSKWCDAPIHKHTHIRSHTHARTRWDEKSQSDADMLTHRKKKMLSHTSAWSKETLMWCTVAVHVSTEVVIRGSGRDGRGTLEKKRKK